ncbi:MAG: hypothetical protein AB8B48_21960, partial [Pseudomonadales bacterium]
MKNQAPDIIKENATIADKKCCEPMEKELMKNLTMRKKVLVSMLVTGILPMLIVSWGIHQFTRDSVKDLTISGMQSITDYKRSQLQDYLLSLQNQ